MSVVAKPSPPAAWRDKRRTADRSPSATARAALGKRTLPTAISRGADSRTSVSQAT